MIAETGCRVIHASDAHHAMLIGRHWLDLEEAAETDRELLNLLLAGRYTPSPIPNAPQERPWLPKKKLIGPDGHPTGKRDDGRFYQPV